MPFKAKPRPEDAMEVVVELVQGTVHALIWGDLRDVPGSRACPKARAVNAKATRCFAEVSRGRSTVDRTPTIARRTERL